LAITKIINLTEIVLEDIEKYRTKYKEIVWQMKTWILRDYLKETWYATYH